MFNLLKKLFSTKDGSHTVVVLNDDGSKPSSSHRLNPFNLWLLSLGILVGTVILVVVLIFFTPLGGYVYNQQNVRSSVIAIQQRVEALQDTLEARNTQLRQIQEIMASGKDTSFADVPASPYATINRSSQQNTSSSPSQDVDTQRLPADAVLISNLLRRSPDFPAPYPVEGTPTRLFSSSIGHYGMDIAAEEGASFTAVANGVILSEEWTLNYGYVIVVQHSQGVISIYKHASSVEKSVGETVLKGDILGTIGDIGILSSGPHLHIEIWKQGVPQDPQNYLINS